MRLILTTLILCYISIGFSQETVRIDYSVDYLIPSARTQKTDTVTIGFDKTGKYIWTDSEYLAKDLGRSIFKGREDLSENSKLGIILNTETTTVQLFYSSGDNEMYMNMALSSLIPLPKGSEEEFELISKNTTKTINVAGHDAAVYEVYPSNDEAEKIKLGLDESFDINNNQLFKKLFQLFFAAEGSSSMNDINLPNGLILNISNQGEVLIEAYNINTKPKIFNINYSITVKE